MRTLLKKHNTSETVQPHTRLCVLVRTEEDAAPYRASPPRKTVCSGNENQIVTKASENKHTRRLAGDEQRHTHRTVNTHTWVIFRIGCLQ